MADERINVFTLGLGGVDVDTDPILTADNATLRSQNATYDPTTSRAGALTKRPGLDRFNTVPMGGAVLGGIEAPYTGTAGAPASGGGGGGDAGDPGGGGGGSTGSTGTSGPGGPGGGGSPTNPPNRPAGATLFAPSGPLFGGKKLIVIGRSDNGVTGASGAGWYVTSKGFNDVGRLMTGAAGTGTGLGTPMNGTTLARLVGGPQAGTIGQTANHDQVVGFPQSLTEGLCARPNGVLFYAQRTEPTPSTSNPLPLANFPLIRRNDGLTDIVVASIPGNTPTFPPILGGWPLTASFAVYVTAHGMAVVGMGTKYGDGSKIYIVVHDRVPGGLPASDAVRVFRLDTTTYALNEIFNSNPLLPSPPYSSNYNALPGTASPFLSGGGVEAWFGGVLEATGSLGTVNALVPSPGNFDAYANWQGYEGAYATKSDVTCMAIFQGVLFVGHANQAATPAFAVINGNPLDSGKTLGADPQLTASGGTAAASNHFCSMAIFRSKLYVSYWNKTQIAKIYSYDGTTWNTVYTSGTNIGDQVPFNLQIDSDGDILYAFGCVDGTPPACFLTSVDGTTWVAKSANLTGDLTASGGGNFSNSTPMNVFADFIQ